MYPIRKYIYPQKNNYNTRFCFITTSYNQSIFIKKNLDSIRNQNYTNYFVNYVNDGSTDDSSIILSNYKKEYPNFPLNIITNKQRYGPCYSRKISYMQTENEDVCVFLDGDDFLIGNNVLHILAEAYENHHIYATFGSMQNNHWQYKWFISYNRKQRNYFPHLRTAKSKIVKQVPDKYLKDSNDEWFMFTTDVALFNAVIELCGNKYMFIENELVIYNQYNNQNNVNDGYNNQNIEGKKKRSYYHKIINNMIPLNVYEGFNKNFSFCDIYTLLLMLIILVSLLNCYYKISIFYFAFIFIISIIIIYQIKY